MNKLFKRIKSFFHHEKLVYTTKYAPGKLMGFFKSKNKKYVRIGFSNRRVKQNYLPVTDVEVKDVKMIVWLPSKFEKMLHGKKAKKKVFTIKKENGIRA